VQRSYPWLKLLAPFSILLALIWSVVRVGPAFLPDLPGWVAKFGSWQRTDLPSAEGRWRENLLHQWVYSSTGSPGTTVWLIEASLFALIAVALMMYVAGGSSSSTQRSRGVRLAILSPAVGLFVGFLGSYDGLTAMLQLLVVVGCLKGWRWLMILAGAGLGLHHPTQGLFSLIVLWLTVTALNAPSVKRPRNMSVLWGVLGLALGKIAASLFLLFTTGSAGASRPYDFLAHLNYGKSSVDFIPIILLAFFSGLWIVAILVWMAQKRRGRILLLIGFAFCSLLTLTDADKTRLFVIIALPGLMVMIRWFIESDRFTRREFIIAECMAWIVPPILIWENSLGMGQVQHLGWIDQFVMSWQMMIGWQ
jgi:hypothetical protein